MHGGTENINFDKRRLESEITHLRENWQREVDQWERRVVELKASSNSYEREVADLDRKAVLLRNRLLTLEEEETRTRQKLEDLHATLLDVDQTHHARQLAADQELSRTK